MKLFLFVVIVTIVITKLSFAQNRGVWFWGSTTLPTGGASPWGSIDVVGDPAKEDDTIDFLTTRSVFRVFGSYQNRPVSEPLTIASWNHKLDLSGIESQILLDGNAVNDPAFVSSLLTKITNRLIIFNNTAGFLSSHKFKALHLDLEPQGLAAWDTGTAADKRALLDDLLNVYVLVRNHLDTAGMIGFPIYADIPFFWDKLPVDGGSVGWADPADRDAWFSAVDSLLDGVSIMTFSKDNSPDLQAATLYERTGPLSGKAVIAIQPKVGPSELWPNYLSFYNVMTQLEIDVPLSDATDIENYAFWRHATTIPTLPVITGVYEIAPDPGSGGTGGIISVKADPGYRYLFFQTDDMETWNFVQGARTPSPGTLRHRFSLSSDQTFFKVAVVPDI